MGRMLDALNRTGEGPNGHPPAALTPAIVAEKGTDEIEADEEVPFIEVGGPGRAVDASPAVLASKPGLAPHRPTQPPFRRPATTVATAIPEMVLFRPLLPEAPLGSPEERFDESLVAFHHPDHVVSEQYRDLLTGLASQWRTDAPQVLMFSPARKEMDASTVLLNLAITAARQRSRRVVVVDTNLKHSALARLLGMAPAPGLREVLTGKVALTRALRETGQLGLVVLTAGEHGQTPSRQEGAVALLLPTLRERFDLALLDGPFWDGRPEVAELGGACDGVYLVTDRDHADSWETEQLMGLVVQQGGPLRGSVLTAA